MSRYERGIKHIETKHGTVNIVTGLSDAEGHDVESVEVIPDKYPGEAQTVVDVNGTKADYLRVRLITGKSREEKML